MAGNNGNLPDPKTMLFMVEYDVIPAVRMTQATKYTDPRAKDYLANKNGLKMLMKNYLQLNTTIKKLPKNTPLYASIIFFEVGKLRHDRDIDNMVKTVLDAANGILIEDDRWIDEIHTRRVAGTVGQNLRENTISITLGVMKNG